MTPSSIRLLLLGSFAVVAWLVAGGCSDGHDPAHSNVPPVTSSLTGGHGAGGEGSGGGLSATLAWAIGTSADQEQSARDVAIDSEGHAIVTGCFGGPLDWGGPVDGASAGLFLTKLDADGGHVFTKAFDGGEDQPCGLAVATDSADNIFVLVMYGSSLDLSGSCQLSGAGDDIALAKFDSSGECQWAVGSGRADLSAMYIGAFGLAVDHQDNLVAVGRFAGDINFGGDDLSSVGEDDIFVVKLDPDGTHLWSSSYGDELDQLPLGVAADSTGIVLVGQLRGSVSFGGSTLDADPLGDAFVVKLDPDGNHLWSSLYAGDSTELAAAAVLAPNGDVVVGGSFSGDVDIEGEVLEVDGAADLFLVRYDLDGNLQWSQQLGDEDKQELVDLAIDSDGNLVPYGNFGGSILTGAGLVSSQTGFDLFALKLTANGVGRWAGGWGSSSQIATAVATDGLDVVIVGQYRGELDLGDGPLPGTASYNAFAARFSFVAP